LGNLFELVSQGKLKPHISARYPLARGAAAMNDMMNRKVIGKVVITN
jgi:NADPH2:quinone reductase